MKTIFLVILAFIAPQLAKGQPLIPGNSVRLALETVITNNHANPQSPMLRYSALYTKQLAQSRWLAEAGVSYMSVYEDERVDPFNYHFLGDRSQRISADLAILFNVLKSNRHTVRIGAGPSFWYQRNGYVRNLATYMTVGGQQIDYITFDRVNQNQFDVGLNLRSEYDYAVSPHFIMGIRLGTSGTAIHLGSPSTQSSLIGTLITVGLSAGYRF